MVRNDRFRFGALAGVLLALGACQDVPLAPRDFAGEYALVDVDGFPLPAVLGTIETPTGECTLEIGAGELVLEGRRFDIAVEGEETCDGEATALSGSVGGEFALFTQALVLSPDGLLRLGAYDFELGEARRQAAGFRMELVRETGAYEGTFVFSFTLAR